MYADTSIGTVKKVRGEASVERQEKLLPLQLGDKLFQSDILSTGSDGAIGMTLKDNTLISIGKNSRIAVEEFLFDPEKKQLGLQANLFHGTAVFLTGKIAKLNKNAMKIKTPTATMGIRGTHFTVKVD